MPRFIAGFEVLGELGHGGMGVVFKAIDPALDRVVALKLLRSGFESSDFRRRFKQEARSAAHLDDPHIVTIFAFGEHEGTPFIAMEFVDGVSLEHLITSSESLSIHSKLICLEALCTGLGYAHRQGIIHRDIKPSNLMINKSGVLKILDFGIAKARQDTGLTQTNMAIGTPNYMAPEQFTSSKRVDKRVDIFAVGAVLYEFLTSSQAFPAGAFDAMRLITTGGPTPPSHVVEGLDPRLDAVVAKALKFDADGRYQDLDDMKADLKQIRMDLRPAADRLTTDGAAIDGLANEITRIILARSQRSSAGHEATTVSRGHQRGQDDSTRPSWQEGHGTEGARSATRVISGVTIVLIATAVVWNGIEWWSQRSPGDAGSQAQVTPAPLTSDSVAAADGVGDTTPASAPSTAPVETNAPVERSPELSPRPLTTTPPPPVLPPRSSSTPAPEPADSRGRVPVQGNDMPPPNESLTPGARQPPKPADISSLPLIATVEVPIHMASTPAQPPAVNADDVSRNEIRDLLERLERAYAELDFAAVRRLWPSAPETLRANFEDAKVYSVEFTNETIEVSGNTAIVTCVAAITQVSRAGRQQRPPDPLPTVITLNREPSGWIIKELR